eukprot:88351-Amphidinium_carterae.2
MVDVAASQGTCEHVPFEPFEEWKLWSTVCQAVRNFLVGPKLRIRPEQWPGVRLPAPEPVPEVVETVATAAFPACCRARDLRYLLGL